MTAPVSLFHHEEAMELDSAAIERSLTELWQQASAAVDGPPVARARVMTLLIYTEDEASAELAASVASTLPEHHPCRAVILHVEPHRSRPLRAGTSIECLLSPGGEQKVCSERITVTAGGEARLILADAVAPLLVPDLPSVLWWTGRPRPGDPVLRRFAAGAVDRVLLDSALFRDPGAGLIALARWHDDPRRRGSIADLAWERLRQWRQLLAQTVDPPEARAQLPRVREITIGYDSQASLPEETLLLAGWLSARLGWHPEDSPAAGVVTFSGSGRPRTLRLIPEDAAGTDASPLGRLGASLRSVRLVTDDGMTFSVRADNRPGIGICAVEDPARESLERLVPLVYHDPVTLVVRALGRRGEDPVYESALAAAAEIAVLGATA